MFGLAYGILKTEVNARADMGTVLRYFIFKGAVLKREVYASLCIPQQIIRSMHAPTDRCFGSDSFGTRTE